MTKYKVVFDRGNGQNLEMRIYANNKVEAFDKASVSLIKGWKIVAIEEEVEPKLSEAQKARYAKVLQQHLRENPISDIDIFYLN